MSESVLQRSTAEGGRLRFGPREWRGLLVLDAQSIEPETARAIERFARAGGAVVFVGRAPDRSPGLFEAEERDRAVRQAIGTALSEGPDRVRVVPAPRTAPLGDLDQTRRSLPDDTRRGLLHWVTTTLPAFDLTPPIRIDAPHPDIGQIRHRVDGREIVFFANTSASEAISFFARFLTPGARPWKWDPETGTRAPYPFNESASSLRVHLEPSESLLLVFEPEDRGATEDAAEVRSSLPPQEWRTIGEEWTVSFEHAFEERSFERALQPREDLSLSPDAALASFAGDVPPP